MEMRKKRISVRFNLGQGEFGADLGPDVLLEGYKCSAEISNVCLGVGSKLALKIYGIPPLIMNKLSTLGMTQSLMAKNKVSVLAGDSDGMQQIFSGTVFSAYADYSAQPDVHLVVDANAGFFEQISYVPPTMLPGDVEVAKVIESIANQIGWTFVNHGVTTVISDVYADGSPIEQLRYLAKAANIACSLDNDCVTIWPNGVSPSDEIISISPETGMIGYPAFSSGGIVVRHLFDPRIHVGGQVQVDTSVPQASGLFNVHLMQHQLSSETPDGPWITTLFMNDSKIFAKGGSF